MSCNKVRKYLFAFADNQLSVQANCEVLDHLKMCRACSAIVDEHQAIRRALRSALGRIPIPPELESRVREAIRLGRPVPRQGGGGSFRARPWFRRLAMAAAVGLVATAVWQFGPWSGSAQPTDVSPMTSEQLASKIIHRHNKCIESCNRGKHQSEQLPHDQAVLATAINDHFNGGQLAAAVPDLSDRGFRFHSANFCCISESDDCISGHVMYSNKSQDAWLSFYSMPRWDAVTRNDDGTEPSKDAPFVYTLPAGDQRDAVVVWHEDRFTYVCCGRMKAPQMKALVQDVRIAMQDPQRREILAAFFGAK